ncbi:MAG: JAB domain-containing protein [Lachnospiraceae bacterium]|nr:JAB domain-containing protein [Lachnospiraceae bacterium]
MKITTDGFGLDICYIKLEKAYKLANDKQITDAKDAINAITDVLKDLDREVMCVITLKTDGTPINASFVSVGTLNAAIACPREIMKSVILSNAASLILIHNHPSGGAHPSSMDIQITDKLNQVCTLLDVNLLDHVIIGEREWFSFREKEMVRNIQHLYAKKVEDVNLTQVAEQQVDYAANNIHRRRSGR